MSFAINIFIFSTKAFKHPDLHLLNILASVIASCGTLFCYCYGGESATRDFLNYADCLFESNYWHELPVDLQKFYILMVKSAQIPLYYHGFGMVNLSLITFSKVLKTVVSYYLMFKQLMH